MNEEKYDEVESIDNTIDKLLPPEIQTFLNENIHRAERNLDKGFILRWASYGVEFRSSDKRD